MCCICAGCSHSCDRRNHTRRDDKCRLKNVLLNSKLTCKIFWITPVERRWAATRCCRGWKGLGLRMRSIDMLKSLLRVFEQEGGHVGWIQRLLFFSTKKANIYSKLHIRGSGLNIQRKGREKAAWYWRLHGRQREERGSLQRLCFNWPKFGRSRSFFSTTSTFELSDYIVVRCRGLAQTWGRAGTNLLLPKSCFWISNCIWVLIAFCLDVPTLSPYPRWHPTEAD